MSDRKKRPATGRKQEACSTPVEVVYRRGTRAPKTIGPPTPGHVEEVTPSPTVETIDVSKYYEEGCSNCGGKFCAGCF